jgi:hypothetical protein
MSIFIILQDAERREKERAQTAQVLANEEAARVQYLAQQEENVRKAEEELRAKYAEMTAKLERQQVSACCRQPQIGLLPRQLIKIAPATFSLHACRPSRATPDQAHLSWQAKRLAHRDALRVFLAAEKQRLEQGLWDDDFERVEHEALTSVDMRGAGEARANQRQERDRPLPSAITSETAEVALVPTPIPEPNPERDAAEEHSMRPELAALKARLDAVKRRMPEPGVEVVDGGAADRGAAAEGEKVHRPGSARLARWGRDGSKAAAQLAAMPLEEMRDAGSEPDSAAVPLPVTGPVTRVAQVGQSQTPSPSSLSLAEASGGASNPSGIHLATEGTPARPPSPVPRDQVPQVVPKDIFRPLDASFSAGLAEHQLPSSTGLRGVKSMEEVAAELDRLLTAMQRGPETKMSAPEESSPQSQLLDVAVSLQQGIVLPIIWQAALADRAGLELIRDELQLPQHLAALRRFLLLESAQFAQAITVGVQRHHAAAQRVLGVGSVSILETALASSGMVRGGETERRGVGMEMCG